MWPKGSVTVLFEPSPCFAVVDETTLQDDIKRYSLDYAIYGILDVIMLWAGGAILNVKITIKSIDYDEIESTPSAFRQAGRIAATRALVELQMIAADK